VGVCFGIVTGLFADVLSKPYVQEVQAATIEEEPKEVRLEIVIDWTPERIEKEIRTLFPEEPNTAVAIFKCESGLIATAKGPTSDYGIAQIHAPSWDYKAIQLGYGDYKTDIEDNLKMARYIYDGRGNFNDWVCYTKGMHKKYL